MLISLFECFCLIVKGTELLLRPFATNYRPNSIHILYTVNVEIFAQYIFSRISRRVLEAQKYDVSEKINHYRADRVNCPMRENLSMRKCRLGLDARKFSCAKISTFTVLSFCRPLETPHIWYFLDLLRLIL